jgi:diaminopimelate epimerase
MKLHFYKYHGCGNDFILIDNRMKNIKHLLVKTIRTLCHRRFGVGADGIMVLKRHNQYDFEMEFYNSDGTGGTMCGNGGRCIAAFAKKIGIAHNFAKFLANDGLHEAHIVENDLIKLKMKDVNEVEIGSDFFYLNTGSPHFVKFYDDIDNIDVYTEGKKIRYNERFRENGTNVNFVSIKEEEIHVRTYERGVEDETLACGTGATASALCTCLKTKSDTDNFKIKTTGGNLKVYFENNLEKFSDIWLEGPAKYVFEGDIDI